MKKETKIKGNKGEIVLYRAQGGRTELSVHLEAETLWLTQKQMAELFETERSVITRHAKNIFVSGELIEKSNVQKMHIPGSDKPVAFYSLDVIISIGYRVNSLRGTQFRIWATRVLKDHLVKGYTANVRRLKCSYPFLYLSKERGIPKETTPVVAGVAAGAAGRIYKLALGLKHVNPFTRQHAGASAATNGV